MARVFIGLGSNLGDKKNVLKQAIQFLSEKCGKLLATSSFYETEPHGFESDQQFLNAVVALETDLDPSNLLIQLKDFEKQLGRSQKTTVNYTDRILDLDILYYSDLEFKTNELEVPHPRLYERNFVLVPLAEIAPDFMDVKTGKSIRYLAENSKDTSIPVKYLG
jgi:2-amino-4-hydroxy-6-hydroxymethyldihydropteridine diphosphokinase